MRNVDRKTDTPLSIAIVGAGKIGSTFAYKLAAAGHYVTAIARPGSKRLAQMQRDGGIVLRTGESIPVATANELDEQFAYDLVIVTVLAHQIEPLFPVLQRSKSQAVHCMFVTFEPGLLQKALGPERCSFGMPFVQALLDETGKLMPTISKSQKTLHGDQRWVDLFNNAGLPSAFEPNMPLWLRCHAPLTVAFESISVQGQRRGGGATWAEAKVVARGLKGGFAIVKGLESRLYPRSKGIMSSLPTATLTFLFYWMSRIKAFRELLATGLDESRSLADRIAAAGSSAKPSYPQAVKAVLAMKP